MSDYWEKNGIIKPQQIVVCAANRIGDIILCGARHWDGVMHKQADAMNLDDTKKVEQGFIDQFGDFLTRKDALALVKQNGQPFNQERNVATDELYSEGLY